MELKFNELAFSNQPWTDPDFGPNDQSLNGTYTAGKFDEVTWKRISDLNPHGRLFGPTISSDNMVQGQLADGYLLAVLGAFAETPAELKSMFYVDSLCKAGCQLVYFKVNGQKTAVMVDDYLPCKNGKLMFAASHNGAEFWMCILEKAWAKLHGSYLAIEQGQPGFVFGQVAGLPSRQFVHKQIQNRNEFWTQLQMAERQNFPVIATTFTGQDTDGTDHCYSLMSLHEFSHKGKNVRLVKLRNQWGHEEWSGAWSEKSELWNKQVKYQLGIKEADSGYFFISFFDFLDHFRSTWVCYENCQQMNKVSDTFHSFEDTVPPQAFFKFRLSQGTDLKKNPLAISVQQQGQRLPQRDLVTQFRPSSFTVSLMRENGTFVDSVFGCAQQLSLVVDPKNVLSAGNYLLMVDAVWNEEANLNRQHKDVIVQIHCQEPVKIDLLDFKKGIDHLAETLKHYAYNQPVDLREFYLNSDETAGDQVWRIQNSSSLDYGFIFTVNNSKQRVRERVTLSLQGCEVIYPEPQAQLILEVNPGSDEIIIIRKLAKQSSFELQSEVLP